MSNMSNLYVPGSSTPPDRASELSSQGLDPMLENAMQSVETYARERPWAFGVWMLGIGFVLGWRLKPW